MVEQKLERTPAMDDPVAQLIPHRRHRRAYDTGEMFSGYANITPSKDTPFGAIIITLVIQEIIDHYGDFFRRYSSRNRNFSLAMSFL
jgi:hypothetical protein